MQVATLEADIADMDFDGGQQTFKNARAWVNLDFHTMNSFSNLSFSKALILVAMVSTPRSKETRFCAVHSILQADSPAVKQENKKTRWLSKYEMTTVRKEAIWTRQHDFSVQSSPEISESGLADGCDIGTGRAPGPVLRLTGLDC